MLKGESYNVLIKMPILCNTVEPVLMGHSFPVPGAVFRDRFDCFSHIPDRLLCHLGGPSQ